MLQQKCFEKIILWLLFPSARRSLAPQCSEDIACPLELIRYAGLWRRSWPYSFLCSSCMFIQLSSSPFLYFGLFNANLNISCTKVVSYDWTTLMQVMQELGLIGLRIQRMPSEPGLEFGIPSQYSYMTVRSYAILLYSFLACSIRVHLDVPWKWKDPIWLVAFQGIDLFLGVSKILQ